jgi:DNA-binding LacI/PurR family transcriptional regulator
MHIRLENLRRSVEVIAKLTVRAMMMIMIRELAKASRFSPTTISPVVNNSPAGQHIHAKTKESIRSRARKLGYYPNQFARSLGSSRSG